MQNDPRDRSIADLLRELSEEIGTLVRAEMQLARAEIVEKAKPAAASAVSFGGTALFGFGAFGAVTAALIAALALALPTWAAALIIAIVYGIVAYVLVENGKKKLREAEPPLLPQTTQTIKDDITWAKTQPKSGVK
jgi:Putative Actinobacterial Holin-X, holin superfamily III